MRNMKLFFKLTSLFFVFSIILSCEKEEANTIDSLQNRVLKIEQIPLTLIKHKHKSFIRQLSNHSIKNNGLNKTESSTIVIDTNNITQITYDDYSSYTFPVIAEDTDMTLKNVLISEEPYSDNSYFLVSYELDAPIGQLDDSNIENHIISKSAIEIEALNIDLISQKNNNNDCWEIDTYQENRCEDADGKIL